MSDRQPYTVPQADPSAPFPQSQPAGHVQPTAGKRLSHRRTLLAAAGVGAVAVVGGGAVWAASVLGGGGPQPEDALPRETIAMAKIDLDPSAGQKLDAIRTLRKFPAITQNVSLTEDSDLRETVVEAIQKAGGLRDLDYATDIEPWLGKRFAVAAVDAVSGDAPVIVTVLAVTDQAKAQAALDRVAADLSCQVGPDFAVCAEDEADASNVVKLTAEGRLTDNPGFARDWNQLGEEGVASYWADLDRSLTAVEDSGALGLSGLDPQSLTTEYTGRTFGALRFDGTSLEMVSYADAPADTPALTAGSSLASLPSDTLAAASFNNLDTLTTQLWARWNDSLGGALMSGFSEELESNLGMKLPDDLAAALGSQTVIAFGGGTTEMPALGLISSGDKALAQRILDRGGDAFFGDDVDGKYVVATTGAYADALSAGGDLGKQSAFKAVMPPASSASIAVYANVAEILQQYATDLDGELAANLKPLGALGAVTSLKGDQLITTIRLSTT